MASPQPDVVAIATAAVPADVGTVAAMVGDEVRGGPVKAGEADPHPASKPALPWVRVARNARLVRGCCP